MSISTRLSARLSARLSESQKEAEEEKEVEKISRIDALCFSVILEECLERLDVLEHIMAKDGLEAEQSRPVFAVGNAHHRTHLADNVPEPSTFPLFMRTLDERETFLESNAKLQDNRDHIANLLESIQTEMLENGSYVILKEAIPIEHNQNRLLAETKEIENELKTVAETLSKGVKGVKEEMKYCLEETEKEILVEREKLQNSVTRALIEFQYMTKKMQSPMAQRSAMLKNQKEKELERANIQTDREHKVHNELMSYLEYAIDSLEEDIQNWMDIWECDAGEKNREISEMNTKKDDIEDNIQDLLELEEEHRKVIYEATTSSDQEKYEQQRLIVETKAATKIQRWWREYLFKRRRKKKKGKGKGGKRQSPKGKSPKRQSPKDRSPREKSPGGKSPKRKSPKRKSPKGKSPKRKGKKK